MSDFHDITWLASYPKSGNTWVRLFLDAYFLGDCDINDIVTSVADDTALRYEIGDGVTDVRRLPVDLQQLTRPMAMLRLVLAWKANKFADVPLFVKTHNAHMVANGIELLPEMLTKNVVYLVRDPRDVCLSFAKHLGCSIDNTIDHMLDKYRVLNSDKQDMKVADFISSWPKAVSSFVNADTHNVRVFRYEDLKSHPEQSFAAILKHAGVEPDMARVKHALELTEIDRLKQQEQEKGFRESSPHAKNQFFGTGKTGGWRGKLTPAQQHRLEKGCQSMMKRLGYAEKRKAA